MRRTVTLAQFAPRLGDIEANLQRHIEMLGQARDRGSHVIVFPELSLTGYHLRDLTPEVAMTLNSPALRSMAEASKDLDIVCGFVEQRSDHRFQVASAYFSGGECRHTHRKVYLPTYGMFDEERYLTPGHGLRAFDVPGGRCGILICEDLWHPATAHILALDGAQVLYVIGNSPGRGVDGATLDTERAYDALCRAAALCYGVYVVFVNRVGFEDGVNFWGGSRVIAPDGEEAARAQLWQEELLTVDLDTEAIRRARTHAPLLANERVDLTLHHLQRIHHERLDDQS